MCIDNPCNFVFHFKLWFQCNHIIFLFRRLCSSVLNCIVLQDSFSQWSTYLAPLISVLSISSPFWVKTNFFLQLFAVILFRAPFCWLLIVLWLTVWHQDFALSMLAYCWGYHWLRALHPVNKIILKSPSVLIQIVLQVSFSQRSTYFSNTTQSCSKNLTRKPTRQYIRDHVLPILLQDRFDSGRCLHQAKPIFNSVFPEASAFLRLTMLLRKPQGKLN